MEKENLLLLDNQLCFSIYACSREISRLYRPVLDELGLTYPQYLVLLVLWEQEECNVKELGERLFLDSGTLTPMLKRMEAAGLITRQRSQTDERVVFVRLTEQGQALKERAYCIPESLLAKSGISEGEFAGMLSQFRQLLTRIHQSNEEANA
ncbi:MarR family transcriptional regulator [Brevibacillus fluminis]|uniref:MarR family transcriptional regulator n=1 Tax=Brevibacillus fluminis TaxID=511487 RepID=A0A3M8DR03_9BACL|nr:MarR family transcriptional regulator [Brevibacillus fluminis]RNB89881.1 MarR family transcriptional regulator [Brevibacillus fluminis]